MDSFYFFERLYCSIVIVWHDSLRVRARTETVCHGMNILQASECTVMRSLHCE